jgi:hypothetical protein
MEIVLLYGGLTSNRRFVFEPRWVTLFSQSLFFNNFFVQEGRVGGSGGDFCLVSIVTSMQECLYHHDEQCVGAKLHYSIYSWKWLCKPTILIIVFVQVQTSLQAELIINIYIIIYIRPQQSMELPDFLWLFFGYIIVCTCYGGDHSNNFYMCVCRCCMSFHTSHKFLFLDYLPHPSGSTPSN